jgi:hypothetical protein
MFLFLFLFVFRVVTALGVVILAARQRMWLCLALGVGLLVIEPCSIVVAILGGGRAAHGLAWTYLATGGLAVAAWRAGVRFRVRHGDTESRREVSHLPLLYSVWLVLELALALALHALRV